MAKLTYKVGDLFASPQGSILVHACNAVGSWGSGIALAFRSRYPQAFEQYKSHCQEHGESLVGTCLLIRGEQHDIACLFTSRDYGRRKDPPEEILNATRRALQDLARQNTEKPLHACRFNSGKFAVPWELTEAIIQDLGLEMTVYDPVVPE